MSGIAGSVSHVDLQILYSVNSNNKTPPPEKNTKSPVSTESHKAAPQRADVQTTMSEGVKTTNSQSIMQNSKGKTENAMENEQSKGMAKENVGLAQGGNSKAVTQGNERFGDLNGNRTQMAFNAGVKGNDDLQHGNKPNSQHGGGTIDLQRGSSFFGTSTMVTRKGKRPYSDEDEEEGGNNQRRRKKAQFQYQPKPLSVLEGAVVAESNTQDRFVSSSVSAQKISGKPTKTLVEELKDYKMTDVSFAFYDIVKANANTKEKNGIGQFMQKELFAELMKRLSQVDDVMDYAYSDLVREIVQGCMRAAHEKDISMKDVTKMFTSGIMAMAPHDDDPEIMAEALKCIVEEVMYGKINIGYNMKTAANCLGAASYTLSTFYKDFQSEVNFNKSVEQTLNGAFNEAIWSSTGRISNFSQAYAKANIESFMAGRNEEEKIYQKGVVKEMLLSPIKKAFGK